MELTSSTVSRSIDGDLLTAAAIADPHSVFAELRSTDPVHWSERYQAWILTRYADVLAAFRDDRLSSDRIRPHFARKIPDESDRERDPVYRMLTRWLVFNDPPAHTRLRQLVQRAFTPRAVATARGHVDELVTDLLAPLQHCTQFDLHRELAFPLPAMVIAHMLGVPPEDRDRFKSWSDDIATLVFGGVVDPTRHDRAAHGIGEFAEYFRRLLHDRATAPRDDLLSELVLARDADDALSTDEVIATATLLLFGGHETTTNLIGNAVVALEAHPDQADLLRERGFVDGAFDELMRYDGPTKIMVRSAVAPVQIGGRTIAAGDRVFLAVTAANRDPQRFRDPDRLHVERAEGQHLGFGFGIHFCLGAPLARMEGAIALGRLLEAFPRLTVAGPLRWQPTLLSRGVDALPVSTA